MATAPRSVFLPGRAAASLCFWTPAQWIQEGRMYVYCMYTSEEIRCMYKREEGRDEL